MTVLRALVACELRQLLRSPRALFAAVALPALVWPLMLLISQFVTSQQEERLEAAKYLFLVDGPSASIARELLAAAPNHDDFDELDGSQRDAARALADGEIQFWVSSLAAGGNEASDPSLPLFRVYFRADRDLSREGSERFRRALVESRNEIRENLLAERGFPTTLSATGLIETRDLASAAESMGLQLGRFISTILVSLLMVGGSVVASDSLAGEKERGTLETLLTTAVSRTTLVGAKQLSIFIVAISITVVQLFSLWLYQALGVISLPGDLASTLTSGRIALLLLLYLPVAALIASALLLTSAYAKSYKEAQLFYFPVFVLALAPTLAAALPAASLRSILVLVPIANLSLAVKEVLAGGLDLPFVVASWVVTAGAATWLAALSVRLLGRESLITSVEFEPEQGPTGPNRFRRDILRWTGVIWAILLTASFLMGADAGLITQLSFNFSVLIAATLFLLHRYRLGPRATLRLRLPKPSSWTAVLLGAPSGVVLAAGLVQGTSPFLPIPEEALVQLQSTLFPPDTPAWRLFLLLAVLPAVVEEIFFRGLLLSGLGARTPAQRILLSALLFGLFHMSFFRFLPTAGLGVLLAFVVLVSGSLFPAVLWHAIHNGIGVFAAEGIEDPSGRALVLATLGMAGALLLLWKGRVREEEPRASASSETIS